MGEENELERLAVEELLKEARRGRVRAETMGPAGWMKCPLGSTNKRFLLNTLRPCPAKRQSGSQAVVLTNEKKQRYDGDREHHSKTRERGHIKVSEHRREDSRSQTGHHGSTRSTLTSSGHSPRPSSKSKRTYSRSPVRERSASKKSSCKA